MARYTKPGHQPVETTSAREAATLKARGYIADEQPQARRAVPRQRTETPPPAPPASSSGDDAEKP